MYLGGCQESPVCYTAYHMPGVGWLAARTDRAPREDVACRGRSKDEGRVEAPTSAEQRKFIERLRNFTGGKMQTVCRTPNELIEPVRAALSAWRPPAPRALNVLLPQVTDAFYDPAFRADDDDRTPTVSNASSAGMPSDAREETMP